MDHFNIEMIHPTVTGQIHCETICTRIHELMKALQPWSMLQFGLNNLVVVDAWAEVSGFGMLLIILFTLRRPLFKVAGNTFDLRPIHGVLKANY
jgi:hypothetical protein